MPKLTWVGKDKVINHHHEVPFRVLKRKYSFTASESDSRENKIIHGDNLEALKSLLPEYEGKVKCIYIDPPYNTGNEGWIYNDNVNDEKIKKWLGQVVKWAAISLVLSPATNRSCKILRSSALTTDKISSAFN